jgi:fumarate hydratase subunit beta
MTLIPLSLPLNTKAICSLHAGDAAALTGTLFTARDAAHMRMHDLLIAGKELPFDIREQTIYYVGPAPASPGNPVGAAGPTSSYRMDCYTPALIKAGLKGMVGKGRRSREVIEAMVRYGAVYFGAVGGTAALLSKKIVKSEIVAYPDLGTEAIFRFEVRDFPVIVLVDSSGDNQYEIGPALYRK